MQQLEVLMPADESNGPVYGLYGDLAYAQSIWLFGGYLNAAQDSVEARFNACMSKARIAVEWGYNNILRQWSFLDFKSSMQVFRCPIGQYYVNAAFLCNLRNCLHGNQTSDYFQAEKLSLEQYLALVD
jgi:hypothetical protein